jgi:outer membrane protein
MYSSPDGISDYKYCAKPCIRHRRDYWTTLAKSFFTTLKNGKDMRKLILGSALFIASLLLAEKPLVAQRSDTMHLKKLQTIWALALKNNPTQKVYRLKTQQNVYSYKASQSYMWPSVSGSFSGQDNLKLPVTLVPGQLINQPEKTLPVQFGSKYAYTAGITASKSILDWQAIFVARVAKSNILLNELQQRAYEQSLKEQVAANFFSALIARASVNLSMKDMQYADSLIKIAQQRLDDGLGDSASVNTALIDHNNVIQNIEMSRQLYEQGINNLKELIGEKPSAVIDLDSLLNPESLQNIPVPSLGADKNLDVYALNITIADMSSKQQRAAFYPSLSLFGFAGSQQYRKDFGLSFAGSDWSDYRYLGINLDVSIFSGFGNLNKLRASKVQRVISQVQYEDGIAQSRINDEQLLQSYNHYLKASASSGANFHLYEKNLELSRQKFEEGLTDISVYFKAFEDYLNSENSHLDNLSKLFTTEATILSRN